MQVPTRQNAKKDQAYVLIVTMAFLVVILIALASTMSWIISNSTTTARNNQFVSSEYAAEGATEVVLTKMESDWLAGTLATNGATYATLIPTNMTDWPIQFVFSDTSSVTNRISVNIGQQGATWQPLPAPYIGLKAYITPVTLTATATPVGQRYNIPATVSQMFNISQIPIFQYLIFYNMNLEIDPGATMNINGPVFSNAGLWSGSTSLIFNSTVWAVQNVVNGNSDPFVSYTGTGNSTYSVRGQPISGANHVSMPIAGTNDNPSAVEGILQWPPSAYGLGSAAAYTASGETYLANYADLIISNAASGMATNGAGTNLFVYYQDPYYQSTAYNTNANNLASSIIWMTNDFYLVTNLTTHSRFSTNYVPASRWITGGFTNQVYYAGYSFLTNVLFYDWREGWNGGNGYGGKGKSVWAVQFDVSKFDIWQANTAVNGGGTFNSLCNSSTHNNHPIGKVYIYNSVPLTVMNLPAVRIVNGSKLPDSYGLSIATPMPLYVLGDFNTTEGGASDAAILGDVADSWPASFLADAITILSSGWSDVNTNQNPSPTSPDTVNAACLEGIVPSSSSVGNTDDTQYSGGVENFLRLLENWGTLYYNGSIVVMFPSQYATNRWLDTGNYYQAPTREWTFDTNFTTQAGLPPFTPAMKTTSRSTWTAK